MSEARRPIAAKPIRGAPGYWLVDTDESVLLASSCQVSGVFPKFAPYVTSGYWDDIALAGLSPGLGRKLAVLGAGMGSFIPLLRTLRPSLELECVEWNREIAEVGMRIRSTLGVPDGSRWHIESAVGLPSSFWQGVTDVFIDLYLPESISPLSLDSSIHDACLKYLPSDGLVFLNVYDQLFGSADESPTTHFVAMLGQRYASGLILRRSASSTIVCSPGLTARQLNARVDELRSAAHPVSLRAIEQTIPFENIQAQSIHSWEKLLRFDTQAEPIRAFAPPVEGLARSAFDTLSSLGATDFVRLSRRIRESRFIS